MSSLQGVLPLPLLLIVLVASAASTPPTPTPYQVVGLADFFAAVVFGELQLEGVGPAAGEKARVALTSAGTDLVYEKGFLVVETKGISGAVENLKAAGVKLPDEVVAAAAKVKVRPKGSPEPLLGAAGVTRGDGGRGEAERGAFPIRFVSSMDTGEIAALFEVAAIILALLTAANVQSIVSFTARRRLYSGGTASLRDSTWNVGIVEGFIKPDILLRDFRALLAFLFALCIVILEVLTVLQTQPGDSCAFDDSSTWKSEKNSQYCFSNATEPDHDIVRASRKIRSTRNSVFWYLEEAKAMMEGVDLKQGIPVNTDVFETSLLSGKAVKQLKDGNYEDRYTAPVIEESDLFGNATAGLIGDVSFLHAMWNQTLQFDADCEPGGLDRLFDSGDYVDPPEYFPTNLEYPDIWKNQSVTKSSSTGFARISSCENVIRALNCAYVKGPIVFRAKREGRGESYFPMELGFGDGQYTVQCKLYSISREDRRTSMEAIISAISSEKRFNSDSIRRAMLATVIAQNSANNVPCERYIAVPKRCTEIGLISVCAISALLFFFVASFLLRLALSLASRGLLNYNGSTKRWAIALSDYFMASGRKGSLDAPHTPRKPPRREWLLGRRSQESEIHMSVSKGFNGLHSNDFVLTRGPIADPATYVPGSTTALPTPVTTETDSDQNEV